MKFIEFNIKNIGKDFIINSEYFNKFFDVVNISLKGLQQIVLQFNLSFERLNFYNSVISESIKFINESSNTTKLKEQIWINMQKNSNYLEKNGFLLKTTDFTEIENVCKKRIIMFHNIWLKLNENDKNIIWKNSNYATEESICWLVLLHLYLYGIRPSSLLQITSDKIYFKHIKDNQIVALFHFEGNDKSQEGGTYRYLGINPELSEQLLFYLKERVKIIYQINNLGDNEVRIFFSTSSSFQTIDSVCRTIKKFYWIVLKKYTFPRMIRFFIGHYLFANNINNEQNLLKTSFLMNHSLQTHLKYYTISDKRIKRKPEEDFDLIKQILGNDEKNLENYYPRNIASTSTFVSLPEIE